MGKFDLATAKKGIIAESVLFLHCISFSTKGRVQTTDIEFISLARSGTVQMWVKESKGKKHVKF